METSLKTRRVHLVGAGVCGLGFLLGLARVTPARGAEPAADQKAAEEVDSGTKKLLAAQGLYQCGLFKLAAKEYADFLSENPKHPRRTAATYALGLCQYRQSDFDRAAAMMNAVLKDGAFAQRADALAVLAQCELAQKHYEKALAALDELLEKHADGPHADSAAINRVQALYSLNKYADAAGAAQKYIEHHAKAAQRGAALYFLTLSQRALGKNDEALASAQAILKDYDKSPYAPDAMLIAGQALEARGKLDEAIEQYRRMAAAAPAERKGDARFSLGVALYKSGKYDRAIEALSAVEGAYAKAAQLQLGLAQLAAGKPADARRTLTPLTSDVDAARAAAAKYGVARCDMADKKFESALGALGELKRLSPPPANAPRIALDHAVCLMELSKFEQAEGEFAAVVKQFADSAQMPEALYRQAYCLHRLKKYEQSHAACALLAGMRSDFAAAGAELDAENLFLLAKYAEAARAFGGLAGRVKDEARLSRIKLRMGQCAYFAGDYAKAVEVLSPLARNPKTASTAELQPALFLLGDALLQQGQNKQAAEALAKFIGAAKGDLAEARYKLALAHLRDKDEQGARKALDRLAGESEQSPWVRRGLVEYGQLLRKMGKASEAAAALKRVIDAKAPEESAAPATYLLGWVEMDAKRYSPAAELFKRVIEQYPKHTLAADAAFRYGAALKEAGELDQAAAALQAFAAAHPQSADAPRARQMAAAALSGSGKAEQAGAVLASLARDPKANDTVLYDLAWAQRGAKNAAGAADTYRRLLKDHPQSKLADAVRAEWAQLLYDEKKFDQAVELLEAVTADRSADPKLLANAYYRLGWCYQKLSKPEKAAAAFAKFDPDKAGAGEDVAASALLQAGLANAQLRKFDAAETALAAMVKKYPKNADAAAAWLRLGEVQAELNKYEASVRSYTTFIETFPKDPMIGRAHFGIGWALENQKKYEQARAEYQKVTAANNGEIAARAQFQIGETYLGEGKFEQALPALLAVEDVYAYPVWSARAVFESGRVFEELKQVDRAKKQYQQLADKYKDAPEAKLARERLQALK